MTSIRVFAQHLSSQNVQSNFALTALANYFHNFHSPKENLSSELINEFIFRSLEFSYWQENRSEMAQELLTQLESFSRHCRTDINFEEILPMNHMQVINIEEDAEFVKIAEESLKNIEKPGEQRKFKKFKDGYLVIHMYPDASIKVQHLTSFCYLRNGILNPLTDVSLHYDASLLLKTDVPQKIRTSAFSTTTFFYESSLIDYYSCKGYIFRQSEAAKQAFLERVPQVLHPLKCLEREFIETHSDPFYMALTRRIENMTQDFDAGLIKNIEPALESYEQARVLLEEVFTNDKLLELLVKELGRRLVTAWQQNKKEDVKKWQKQSVRSVPLLKTKHLLQTT